MKRESELKSALMRELRATIPGAVAMRHEDRFTSGIPDLSVTVGNCTTWWEFKHAVPSYVTDGIQELTMLRLAAAGYARYVIWHETHGGFKRTMIVRPRDIKDLTPEAFCVGFDHKWLVNEIRKAHRL